MGSEMCIRDSFSVQVWTASNNKKKNQKWCVNVVKRISNALIKIQTRTSRDPTGPATTFRGRAGDDADNHNVETRVARARTAHNRSLLKARGLRGSVQLTRLRSIDAFAFNC